MNIPAADAPCVIRGQVWEWRPGGREVDAVRCFITRVARDGSWADLRVYTGNGGTWSKRQPLPFPGSFQLTPEFVPPGP